MSPVLLLLVVEFTQFRLDSIASCLHALLDFLPRLIVCVTGESLRVEVSPGLVHLFFHGDAALFELASAGHHAFFELVRLFVEVLTLFVASTLLLVLPLLLVASYVGALTLSPVLPLFLLECLELGVQFSVCQMRSHVQVHAALLQLSSPRQQASFELVGLFVELFPLTFATPGLFAFPLLQLAIHVLLALSPLGLESSHVIRRFANFLCLCRYVGRYGDRQYTDAEQGQQKLLSKRHFGLLDHRCIDVVA